MKNILFILVNLLLVFGFSCCVLREPESKPDYTKTGKQIFLNAENEVISLVVAVDNALKLNTYKNTPDSLKETVRGIYFPKYGIKFNRPDKWFIVRYPVDTICTVVIDENSIHTPGANWMLKSRSSDQYYSLKCVEKNKWTISGKEIRNLNWLCTDSLELQCTDTFAPLSFEKSNFTVKGKGELTTVSGQQVLVKYQIAQALVHDSTAWMFKDGRFDLMATEVVTNRTKYTTAEYVSSVAQRRSVRVAFEGMEHLYENLECYYYINYE